MRFIILIFLILSSSAYGQRKPRTNNSFDDAIKKGDSLEILYVNESLFKIATDTLPLYSDDESDGWRYMKLVHYFYDNSNSLKKISFFNGGEGQYYFYFEGDYLRKVRVYKHGGLMNLQYYFTYEDNWLTSSEIEQRMTGDPESKELYELLKTAKTFLDKFKTLL